MATTHYGCCAQGHHTHLGARYCGLGWHLGGWLLPHVGPWRHCRSGRRLAHARMALRTLAHGTGA
ncbi:MAG: hypothetical protein LC674_01445 [Actinobacteria bacterium]|nr:hypothetical protein [Actinomycetota bacterium]